MKTIYLTVVLCFVVFVNIASDPTSKRRILIVGVSKSYFNPEDEDALSKANNVPLDSVYSFLNKKMINNFSDQVNSNFDYQQVDNVSALNLDNGSIQYLAPEDEDNLTTVKVAEHYIKSLCEQKNVEMVLFVNKYDIAWKEDYASYFHTIDLQVFNNSGEKVELERIFFMQEDLQADSKYENRLSKSLSKLFKRLEKKGSESNALVNR